MCGALVEVGQVEENYLVSNDSMSFVSKLNE